MSFPLVLLQPQARNESQDTKLTTVKLTPNAHSNFQTRFVIPVQGHVLDSNSALVWRIEWDNYDDGSKDYEKVVLKQFSGGLNTIRRARFYIGGREIFSSEDVGHLVHIKRMAKDTDFAEEMMDKQIGSQHGYLVSAGGKMKPAPDGVENVADNRYTRQLGSGSKGIECSLLLSEIFSALESLQLPTSLDQMRIELDWETSFDEVATIISEGDGTGGNNAALDATRKNISIKDPVLLLDYLSFDEDMKAGLDATIQSGMALPYVHTSMSSKILAENAAATARTDDVQIALQGKLLMKMYVSHRFADQLAGADAPWFKLHGRCRSQRGLGFKYNLFINDLSVHDLPVDNQALAYSYLEATHQKPVSTIPGSYEKSAVALNAAVSDADVVDGATTISGVTCGTSPANATAMTAPVYRDGIQGSQGYIGFDLSKYDEGSRVVPANAGYRVGSAPVILRIEQVGSATANSPEREPKTVQVFAEEVKTLQIRGGVVDVMDN